MMSLNHKSNQNNPYLTMFICVILLFLLVAFSLFKLVPRSDPHVELPSPSPVVITPLPSPVTESEVPGTDDEEYDDSGIYEEGGLRYTYSQGSLEVSCIDEGTCSSAVRGYAWKQAIKNGNNLTYSQLKTVTIGEGILSIEKTAFSNCGELLTVHLPSTLLSIDDFGFANCKKLNAVYLLSEDCVWSNSTFQGCPNLKIYTGADPVVTTNDAETLNLSSDTEPSIKSGTHLNP